MDRVRLKRWGTDHIEDPKKKKFTLCNLMLPWKLLEPKGDRICVVCRKVFEKRYGYHPMVTFEEGEVGHVQDEAL